MRRLYILTILLMGLWTAVGRAGEADTQNLDILRDTIRANKKALVAVNLNLTDEEAGKFWPVYDEYQAQLTAVNDRLLKIVQDYTAGLKTMTDATANDLTSQYLQVEEDRAKVRLTFLPKIQQALPGRKVAALLSDREQDRRGDAIRAGVADSGHRGVGRRRRRRLLKFKRVASEACSGARMGTGCGERRLRAADPSCGPQLPFERRCSYARYAPDHVGPAVAGSRNRCRLCAGCRGAMELAPQRSNNLLTRTSIAR